MNLFPREVPRVLNLFPRELIESTPKDFPNANPKLHQRPGPQPKTRGAAGPKGLPEENPEGYFQSTLWGTNLELEGLPEGTDSPHYNRGFSTDCHSKEIFTVNKRTE